MYHWEHPPDVHPVTRLPLHAMSKQSRWEVDQECCPCCATRTQRVMWICLVFWLLMVPVIVVPIVLTTQTVHLDINSAFLTCTPRLDVPNGTCASQADQAQNHGGTIMNITLSVNNPNYRPGKSNFHFVIYGSQYALTPTVGWNVPQTTVSAKGTTNITVSVPVGYYAFSQIDPFFYAQVWAQNGVPGLPTQAFNISITGSMQTSIGSISTQNINFNKSYTMPAGS